ncbi:MAG: hypothetical protein N2645_14000 [Clostridia bacterium]|nr:hypothetical protein [Clostridia bacterium]
MKKNMVCKFVFLDGKSFIVELMVDNMKTFKEMMDSAKDRKVKSMADVISVVNTFKIDYRFIHDIKKEEKVIDFVVNL